ncbi:MAG: sulfur carrier protein ThiS [Hyphomonadaceae bacterium]
MEQISVFLNGEPSVVPSGATVAQFLDRLGLPRKGIAVERNREIVPKSRFDTTILHAGDQLEVVQFVGGG